MLPVPVLTPAELAQVEQNPPAWKTNSIAAQQANLDNKYLSDLGAFNQASQEWITDAQESQASGKPLPIFQLKPPVRGVMYPTPGNSLWFEAYATDPTIKPPSIPPFTTSPNTGTQLGTGAGTQSDIWTGMLTQCLNDLALIKKTLGIN